MDNFDPKTEFVPDSRPKINVLLNYSTYGSYKEFLDIHILNNDVVELFNHKEDRHGRCRYILTLVLHVIEAAHIIEFEKYLVECVKRYLDQS